jgi:hypothetical protein
MEEKFMKGAKNIGQKNFKCDIMQGMETLNFNSKNVT